MYNYTQYNDYNEAPHNNEKITTNCLYHQFIFKKTLITDVGSTKMSVIKDFKEAIEVVPDRPSTMNL